MFSYQVKCPLPAKMEEVTTELVRLQRNVRLLRPMIPRLNEEKSVLASRCCRMFQDIEVGFRSLLTPISVRKGLSGLPFPIRPLARPVQEFDCISRQLEKLLEGPEALLPASLGLVLGAGSFETVDMKWYFVELYAITDAFLAARAEAENHGQLALIYRKEKYERQRDLLRDKILCSSVELPEALHRIIDMQLLLDWVRVGPDAHSPLQTHEEKEARRNEQLGELANYLIPVNPPL